MRGGENNKHTDGLKESERIGFQKMQQKSFWTGSRQQETDCRREVEMTDSRASTGSGLATTTPNCYACRVENRAENETG